jgi:hypothetical protein
VFSLFSFLKGVDLMSNQNASPITASDFVSAYVETHKSGGTISDLATRLDRSVEQVRAKKNSLSAQLKERGVNLPSLKRQSRGGTAYDEAAMIAENYLSSLMETSDSQDS